MMTRTAFSVVVFVAAAHVAAAQTAVGTAFTYQGRLSDGGAPANGNYDLQFTVYDASAAGAQVGPTVVRSNVALANGLFTVSLDFGAGVFTGSARWLAVGVRPAGSAAPFTVLGTRQELTPTPNATFSSSTPWSGLIGLSCAATQVPKWSGTAWACSPDANSGGTVTSVTGGTGLTGGTITTAGTLAVDPTVAQSRVTGSCSDGSSIRAVNQNGSGLCQPDGVGADWHLYGNIGTNAATNFIGTTDAQAFELRVNNRRALRIEPYPTNGTVLFSPNLIGGADANGVIAGVEGAVIAGGGSA